MLVFGTVSNYLLPAAYAATSTLTVNGLALDGKPLSMWIVVQSNGSTVATGFTPLTFAGATGSSYSVIAHDYSGGSIFFDHWENGSASRTRTITLDKDTTLTAYYKAPISKSSHILTVNAYDQNDKVRNMYTTIREGSTIVKTGFTPMSYTGNADEAYSVTVSDYGSLAFDYWENESTTRARTVTLNADTTITAHYMDGAPASSAPASPTPATSSPSPYESSNPLIPKTGVFVALYMYPGTTGWTHYQTVIDAKKAHPSVPIVVAINPSSGPGSSQSSAFVNAIDKLRDAGIIVIGYVYDDYGTRSLSALKADVDKYWNWYKVDGIFIDEFTNKVGSESHYRDLTTYAKSMGMKITMGNPGTDVPQSYVGTVDVINITEGKGYMPISWLQHCINCSAEKGWHYKYDKANFAFIRYDITNLDTAYVTEASKWVGLMYITTGNDSNGRWFHVPPYFGELVATLDR